MPDEVIKGTFPPSFLRLPYVLSSFGFSILGMSFWISLLSSYKGFWWTFGRNLPELWYEAYISIGWLEIEWDLRIHRYPKA